MKIAFITRHYNKSGGISRYVTELAERFAIDNEVHIFTASWKDVKNDKIIFHKIPILCSEILKNWKKYAWNNVFEIVSFMLNSYNIKYNEFDIVHSQGDYLGKMDLYTAHSCHLAWLDIVRNRNLNLLEKIKKSSFNPLHYFILKTERHSFKKSKRIISISQITKREIINYYGISNGKISYIPNGVDTEMFNPKNKNIYRKEIRDRYFLKEKDFVLIFPAHEFKRKGLYQIIEALKILEKDNVYLLVVGRDDPTPFLKLIYNSQLKNKIIFTGETSNIAMYYAACDALVFPTSYEPFGLVILEAMSTGLPVIVSSETGASELIKDRDNGLLLKNNKNIEELAEKINFLVRFQDKRKRIGEAARKTAENYSWERISEKTFNLYLEIRAEKKGYS